MGGDLHQPHPGARFHCCRCSFPGLTGFAAYRRGRTDIGHHKAGANFEAKLSCGLIWATRC